MPQEVAAQDGRSAEEIGLSGLAHARSYAQNVARATDRVAELLREARIEEANELFAQALDALNVLVFTIDNSAPLLEAGQAERCPSAQRESEPWISQLLEAQGNQDWVRVADVLEYDVRPSLDGWSEAIGSIAGVACDE